jgi:hypothetical protein
MKKPAIGLDWKRLLGFDQANPEKNPLASSPKIGENDARGFADTMNDARGFADTMATPLRAKVGDKGVPGTIGRPQQLGLLLGR